MALTRRDVLTFASVAGGSFAVYRFGFPRLRSDACVRCGPGNHVRWVQYGYIDMRLVTGLRRTEPLAEDEPEYELVVVPMGTDRSAVGPPWRCTKCGRTWDAPHPDPFRQSALQRFWSWLTG